MHIFETSDCADWAYEVNNLGNLLPNSSLYICDTGNIVIFYHDSVTVWYHCFYSLLRSLALRWYYKTLYLILFAALQILSHILIFSKMTGHCRRAELQVIFLYPYKNILCVKISYKNKQRYLFKMEQINTHCCVSHIRLEIFFDTLTLSQLLNTNFTLKYLFVFIFKNKTRIDA